MGKALVIVDLQNEYFKGGQRELIGIDDIARNIKTLLFACRDKQIPVFFIQHISSADNADAFLPNSWGAQINDAVRPLPDEQVIQKHFPNSFRNTDLLKKLKTANVDQLILCGAMSHMCVEATTRAAFDFGYKSIVVTDACAAKDLVYHGQTIPAQQVHSAFMAALYPVYANTEPVEKVVASICSSGFNKR